MKWPVLPLKHLAALPITNGVGEAAEFDEPAWPRYVRTTDIAGPRELRSETFRSLPPEVAQRALLRQGDIVMTAAGGVGKSLLYTSPQIACYAGYLVRFRAREGVDPRFIAYWTESQHFWDQVHRGTVVSTIDNFSAGKYQNLRCPAPPSAVQRTIADFLDTETTRIDALVAKKRRLIAVLLEWRRATTFRGVSGFLTGPRDTGPCSVPWLEAMPSHWRSAKLSLVARLGSGHTPSRAHPEWWVDCTIPWITTGEVAELRSDRVEYVSQTREQLSLLGIANSAAVIHPEGTVVLCRTASAGYSAIMGANMATSQDFATWTCGPLLRPRYLLLCLRAMREDLLGRLAMGSTHKTIYMPDIESIRIPLPPVHEQEEIVEAVWERLRRVDAIVDLTERQIGLLSERRQALITAAVAGELDIPGAAA